jgi:hypothetical protein
VDEERAADRLHVGEAKPLDPVDDVASMGSP